MEPKPFVDLSLSLGDLIQAATVIIAIVGAYYGLRGQLDIFRLDITNHATEIRTARTDIENVRESIVELVRDVANLTGRIDSMTERRQHPRS